MQNLRPYGPITWTDQNFHFIKTHIWTTNNSAWEKDGTVLIKQRPGRDNRCHHCSEATQDVTVTLHSPLGKAPHSSFLQRDKKQWQVPPSPPTLPDTVTVHSGYTWAEEIWIPQELLFKPRAACANVPPTIPLQSPGAAHLAVTHSFVGPSQRLNWCCLSPGPVPQWPPCPPSMWCHEHECPAKHLRCCSSLCTLYRETLTQIIFN